ncbi:rod-determining factor RdfA [Halalkalicoccus ordinarius]|uniref:rod-determining factor RdfA n=1 Tax=Halalkalicoccus ordinarius TaxID=3116651 RepID=UPI00300EC616
MSDDQTEPSASERGGKVGRIIGKYGLDGTGAELEARWTGDGDDRYSLRALADLFNRRVLEAALEDADARSLEGDVETRYRLLTDDDVSAGMRQQARRELERTGIGVESLESDFVSHQSIYTYLTDHRGASHPSNAEPKPEERIEREIDKINALANRTRAVTADSIDRLTAAGLLAGEESSVFVDVRVTCETCGSVSSAASFLESGGCSCSEGD